MRIVNVEDYFIPDAGYQINILPKYLEKFGHEVWIVTSTVEGIKKPNADFFGIENIEQRDEEYFERTGVKIIRIPPLFKRTIASRIIQRKELFNVVESLNPDVVFVHGNDTFTGIQYILRRNLPFKLVTDSHMLSMASNNKFHNLFANFYRTFVTPKILKRGIPVIRTQNDDYIERNFGIPLSDSPWISYGSDTIIFKPSLEEKIKFREDNDIGENDFVIVCTGKLDEAKGGKLLAEAFIRKFNTSKNIVLVIVGTLPGEYGKEVERMLGLSENRIIRFPTQKYFDLPVFYQAADLSIFAKQCSLSFYDAQACGLPVLSEDNNINVDRCSHGNGWNFISGSVDDLRKKIEQIANMSKEDYLLHSNAAYRFITEKYNYEDKAREYESILLK